MKKKGRLISFLLVAICIVAIFATTGFFVVQPIGMLPEGTTIWYWRVGLDLPLFSSTDGFLLKKMGSVSLFTRAAAMGELLALVSEKKIANFPYVRRFYLWSTGGREFEE